MSRCHRPHGARMGAAACLLYLKERKRHQGEQIGEFGRVEDGRGCLGAYGQRAPFPVPAHRTGRADLRRPALRLASSRAHGGQIRSGQAFETDHTAFSVDHVVGEPCRRLDLERTRTATNSVRSASSTFLPKLNWEGRERRGATRCTEDMSGTHTASSSRNAAAIFRSVPVSRYARVHSFVRKWRAQEDSNL